MKVMARVRERLESKPESVETFPFGEEVAVFKVGGKIYALLDEAGGSVSLKGDPADNLAVRQMYPAVTAGYHLNKQHWNTVVIAGVPIDEVLAMVDASYDLIVTALPRRVRDHLR